MTETGIQRLDWLEAARGWAIAGVVLVHASIGAGLTGALGEAGMFGQRGVQLFYVLSAFTICLSLDGRRDAGCRPFFIRRVARVGPLFWLAILLHQTMLRLGMAAGVPATGTQLVLGFSFLHAIDPGAINSVAVGGWSVAVEFAFYAVAPLLHSRLRTAEQAAAATIAAMLCCGGGSWWLAGIVPRLRDYLTFSWPPVELPVFLLGITAYRAWPLLRPQHAPALAALGLALLLLSLPTRNATLYLSSTGLALLLLAAALRPSRLLVNGSLRWLGRLSYSLYLMHFFCLPPVTWLLGGLARHGLVAPDTMWALLASSGLTLALALPLSVATHRLLEQPGIRLGARLIAGRRPQAAVATPAIA